MKYDHRSHLDIFSGIGGFALAAREAGFETVAFCESDERCQTFLGGTWGLPVEPDIRELDGRRYAGISLLTGGPPCQSASRAGKQGGEGDDRWLWPEALRVLDEAKPDCVVFENPPGILDVGIDGILSEMGRVGYEAQPFDIPACAVDSPQLRHRIWIVGFLSDSERKRSQEIRAESNAGWRICAGENSIDLADVARNSERGIRETAGANGERVGKSGQPNSGDMARAQCERSGRDEQERGSQRRAFDRRDSENKLADSAEPGRETRDTERSSDGRSSECPQSLLADTERERRQRRSAESRETQSGQSLGAAPRLHWQNSIWVPCADGKLRRAPDNSFDLVDGLTPQLTWRSGKLDLSASCDRNLEGCSAMSVKPKKKLLSRRDKGLRYPVEFVASELGLDRKTVERRCEEAGFHFNGAGLTFREAYDALSLKSESDSALRRKRIADATSAETDTLNKQRLFVYRSDHKNIVKDLAVQVRVRIESASYIPADGRRRLIKEIAEIKPSIAEPSHK